MTRGLRWLVGVGVLATVITGCGKGAPVAGEAQVASSSPAAVAVSSAAPTSVPTTTVPSTTVSTTTTTAPTTSSTTTTPSTTTTAVAPTTTTAPTATPSTAPPAVPPSPPPVPSAGPTQWVVQPGESFWSIATSIADTRAGGHATAKAVDSTWRALIDANRGQLPKPHNPSLLYVGTILTVPP